MPKQKQNPQAFMLRKLTDSKEWSVFADLYLKLRERWKSQLIQFHAGNTVEQIALERVRIGGQMEGTELLFREVDRILNEENENARTDK